MTEKLRSIQVLRALAACAVALLHTHGGSGPVDLRYGAAGVDLFFVISGFIMATVSEGKTPGRFLSDRLWRIYPIWLVAAVPWIFIKDAGLWQSLSTITLWPIYENAYYKPAIQGGWSLTYEMLFYFIFAATLAYGRKGLFLIFGALLVLGALFPGVALFAWAGGPIVLEFLFGVIVAMLPKTERYGLAIMALGFVALAFAPVHGFFQYVGPSTATRALFAGIPAALIVYGAVSFERHFASQRWAIPLLIGNASYSIYLLHPLFVPLDIAWQFKFAGGIGLGIIAYYGIERSVMRLRRRWQESKTENANLTSGEVRRA